MPVTGLTISAASARTADAQNAFAEPESTTTTAAAADLPRFVRVLQRGPGDLVRFEFAIGWPDLSAELVLPQAAFASFCDSQKATLLPAGETSPTPGLAEEDSA